MRDERYDAEEENDEDDSREVVPINFVDEAECFFKCRSCPLSYPFDYNLMDHKDKVHKQDNKSKYMCKKCKKAFASFNALSHHVALNFFLNNVVNVFKQHCI